MKLGSRDSGRKCASPLHSAQASLAAPVCHASSGSVWSLPPQAEVAVGKAHSTLGRFLFRVLASADGSEFVSSQFSIYLRRPAVLGGRLSQHSRTEAALCGDGLRGPKHPDRCWAWRTLRLRCANVSTPICPSRRCLVQREPEVLRFRPPSVHGQERP